MTGLVDSVKYSHSQDSVMKFRRDVRASRYGIESLHGAPHKPFLMLAVLQGIDEGRITENLIEPSIELELSFWEHSDCLDIHRKRDMWLPFFHMNSEPYWDLLRHDGGDTVDDGQPKSTTKLRRTYIGAKLSEEFWGLVSVEANRNNLRDEILVNNFHPDVHSNIKEMERVAILSNHYAEEILGMKPIKSKKMEKPVRDAGFRKAVQHAYNHTCAFTGTRLLSHFRHTIIDAAHIRPWSESHDDSLENGVALSKNCHWAFDRGMLSIDEDRNILVSERISDERMFAPGLIELEGRKILSPSEGYSPPSDDALEFHRKSIFIT